MKDHHKWAVELDRQLQALGLPDGSWSLQSFDEQTNQGVIEIRYPKDWTANQIAAAQALVDVWPTPEIMDKVSAVKTKAELKDQIIEAMADSILAGNVSTDPFLADVTTKVTQVTPLNP